MCNNNGACRKRDAGVMCPSFRVTDDEKHVTRGRANALRLALSGQLGPNAFASDDMADTMSLCVSCKACRRECPTGVDMARMKIEVQAARLAETGYALRDRLVAFLPHYAPYVSAVPTLVNALGRIQSVARATEHLTGLSHRRTRPRWRDQIFAPTAVEHGPVNGREVVLFADTFNRYFDPHILDAALVVLVAGGYRVITPRPADGSRRPLCCGRTFLSVGDTQRARNEARRTLATLAPLLARDIPVVGLEPSCLLGFRDEIPVLLANPDARKLATLAVTFEELLARDTRAGHLKLDLAPLPGANEAIVHGHCHQKAFGAYNAVETVLKFIPGLSVKGINSSCCGMAGAFGYRPETIDVSFAMAEATLLPAIRQADRSCVIVADGTSCRHQISDGTGRRARHVAEILCESLQAGRQ
jgi:Fe-S oxidoreductase